MRSLRKLLYTILLMGSLFTTVSCEDLAFGDKFLQKPQMCIRDSHKGLEMQWNWAVNVE